MGEVISMKEWEKAQFIDWATRFATRLLSTLSEPEQKHLIKKLERATLAHQHAAQEKP